MFSKIKKKLAEKKQQHHNKKLQNAAIADKKNTVDANKNLETTTQRVQIKLPPVDASSFYNNASQPKIVLPPLDEKTIETALTVINKAAYEGELHATDFIARYADRWTNNFLREGGGFSKIKRSDLKPAGEKVIISVHTPYIHNDDDKPRKVEIPIADFIKLAEPQLENVSSLRKV